MSEYVIATPGHLLASAYGEGAFSSDAYNGAAAQVPQTETPQTTVPGTPNTGFFQNAFSGASEMSLIPVLLVIAVAIGALTVGVRKLIRKNK